MIRGDFHMHTMFSADSDAPVKAMLNAAVEKGLETVCITDHFDKDFPETPDFGKGSFQFDVREYFQVMEKIKEEYKGKLNVRIGVEIGLQPHLGGYYEQMLSSYPFDFVIGSVHVIRGQDPYYREIFKGRTDREVYREAFQVTLENLDNVETFDVLGHLDYVVRYGTRQAEEYSYRDFAEEIDGILKKLLRMGKGLEMNMAGFKYGLGFCNPHPDVLKRYGELGGEIITVGADAHRPEHVAYDFKAAGDILKACGFRYYTEFEGRAPVYKKIP